MQHGYVLTEPMGRRFDPQFRPEWTPKEMVALGVFGGKHMTDGRAEFPIEGSDGTRLRPDRHDPALDRFGVNASQPLLVWRENGWIHGDDPRDGSTGTAAASWGGGVRMAPVRSAAGRRCSAT